MTGYTLAFTDHKPHTPNFRTMKNALQEQLLKAGLATEKQINKANADRKRSKKQTPKKAKAERNKEQKSDLANAYEARRKQEQKEHAEAQRLAAQRKANRAQVRQLVKENTLNKEQGEEAFQFVVGSNVKKVYVDKKLKDKLVVGELGITFQDGARCVVPAAVIAKIIELDPDKTVFINRSDDKVEGGDDYAGFEVPDDLDW